MTWVPTRRTNVDKIANKIAVHTNSDDALIRANGRWLIKEMKAAVVPEL
jgi:hypothetical protein